MGEVCTGLGSNASFLSFDLCLVGLASVLSRRLFPRRGDSSVTSPAGGLAGVDDATGLNASTGEDWVAPNVGVTRFGLVSAILRGDGSLREREATDAGVSDAPIAVPLMGVRGNAAATKSVVLNSEAASPRDSTGGLREGSSTAWGSRGAGVGTLLSESSDGRFPNWNGLEKA